MTSNNQSADITPSSAPAAAQDATSGPASLSVAPIPVRPRMSIPVSFVLSYSRPRVNFNLRSDATFLTLVSFFESVILESFDVSILVRPGVARSLRCAFSGVTTDLAAGDFLTAPASNLVYGATYTSIKEDFVLPSSHSFGREIKGATLGNPFPVFHLLYSGATAPANNTPATDDVFVRAVVTVSYSGVGVFHGLNR